MAAPTYQHCRNHSTNFAAKTKSFYFTNQPYFEPNIICFHPAQRKAPERIPGLTYRQISTINLISGNSNPTAS
jgi:hypothetical protein